MYPRNNASPEPIAIGAVIQISDGAVQTSGCTVRIRPIGVSEGAGAGTIAYTTDGVVMYTPTQGETNYTSFVLIASKAGCVPVAVTVVTTDAATPGRVRLDGVTHTGATVPAVTTTTNLTNLPSIPANWLTAAGLAADAVTEIQSGLATAASQTAIETKIDTIDGIVDAILVDTDSTIPATLTIIAGYIDTEITDIRNRLPATLDSGRMRVVVESINANVVNASALAADAVTEIQSGLATAASQTSIETKIDTIDGIVDAILVDTDSTIPTLLTAIDDFIDTEVNAIKLVTDKLDTMLVVDGAVWQLTTNSLENAPAGGGGAGDASQATLLLVKAKTDLINAGTVTVNSPTTATGSVRPIVIGDDYLAANGRAFTWTIPAVTGVTAGTAQVYFGGTSATDSFLAGPGTATDNGNGTWTLSVDMPRAISSLRKEEQYEWTVGVQAAGGNKITPVRWGERLVFVESHTW